MEILSAEELLHKDFNVYAWIKADETPHNELAQNFEMAKPMAVEDARPKLAVIWREMKLSRWTYLQRCDCLTFCVIRVDKQVTARLL